MAAKYPEAPEDEVVLDGNLDCLDLSVPEHVLIDMITNAELPSFNLSRIQIELDILEEEGQQQPSRADEVPATRQKGRPYLREPHQKQCSLVKTAYADANSRNQGLVYLTAKH